MNVQSETLRKYCFAQDEIDQINTVPTEKPERLAARLREERSQQRANRRNQQRAYRTKRKPRLHCSSRIKVNVAALAANNSLCRFVYQVQEKRRRAA